MTITPALFEAYRKCPTKCWLRATGEPFSGNAYVEWVRRKAKFIAPPRSNACSRKHRLSSAANHLVAAEVTRLRSNG